MPGSLDYTGIIQGARDGLIVGAGAPSESDRTSGRVVTGNPVHDKLLALIKKLKTDGADCLSAYESDLEKAEQVYRAFRVPDEDDKKAEERGEPVKIIYPITYAQIQTTLAMLMSMFDRNPFLELEGRGPHFHRPSKLMEQELQYQIDQAGFILYFHQWLLDMLRFGFGKINTTWEAQQSWVRGKREINVLGFTIPLGEEDKLVTSREGAMFTMDDPFLLCFDPSVSIGEIQKGQYVFFQEYLSRNELNLKADAGYYYNTEDIPSLPYNTSDTDTKGSAFRKSRKREGLWARPPVSGGDQVTLDHCYVKLVPKDYSLSEHDKMQIWCITMANEARIVRAEPSRFEHGLFPTSTIEYSPDLNSILNPGMAATIDGLQETVNWLINSHIANVRRVINDKIFIAEGAVNIEDIKNRRHYVRVAEKFARLGIDKFFKQIPMADVTQTHMQDAASIYQHLQRVTGINDNFMGMQMPTRRTATEASFMRSLGSDRMKLLAKLIFIQGLRPLGMQMIQNTQQFMSTDRWLKVNASMMVSLGMTAQEQSGWLNVAPEQLQGMFNISMSEYSTPQDKAMAMQTLTGVIDRAMQAPILVPLLGLKIAQLISQTMVLGGVRNPTDFMNPPPPDDPMYQMFMMQLIKGAAFGGRPVQAQVMGEEDVMNQAQRGNLVGMPTGSAPNAMGGMNGGGSNGPTDRVDNFS